MSSKEREHKYAFVVTLLFIFAATGIFIYNSPVSTTGYVSYDSLDDTCKFYFGDKVCDDSPAPADCGSLYKSGTSLDACDECQTTKDGKLGYPNCGEEGATTESCKSYFGDTICDDSLADCGGSYKAGTSLDACDECQTTKDGKLGFDKCGGAGKVEDNSCKDSCGGASKTGSCWCDKQSLKLGDSCLDIATYCPDIASTQPPVGSQEKPNLYVGSLEIKPIYWWKVGTIVKKSGLYGTKKVWTIINFVPTHSNHYFEINEDGSIIKSGEGHEQRISFFNVTFEISNNGIPTTEEFEIELQKLKKDSSGWDKKTSKKLVLLDPKTDKFSIIDVHEGGLHEGSNKYRVILDTKSEIEEADEKDNEKLFDIVVKKI